MEDQDALRSMLPLPRLTPGLLVKGVVRLKAAGGPLGWENLTGLWRAGEDGDEGVQLEGALLRSFKSGAALLAGSMGRERIGVDGVRCRRFLSRGSSCSTANGDAGARAVSGLWCIVLSG